MDTRDKILTAEAALAISARPIVIVAGTFDVLRAEHARQLREARTRSSAAAVLVVVLPCAAEVLPQRARAELVAALRAVDYVVLGGPVEFEALVHALAPTQAVTLEHVDRRLSRELRDRILTRR